MRITSLPAHIGHIVRLVFHKSGPQRQAVADMDADRDKALASLRRAGLRNQIAVNEMIEEVMDRYRAAHGSQDEPTRNGNTTEK